MSSDRVFAFVEGRLDRRFFDRLFFQVCNPRDIGYQIFAMKELDGGTGGKSALISKFQEFRRIGLLAHTAFGKSMVCIFLADKDSDDFTRRQLRSAHLIYSPTYDLEGHLFSCGDLTRALADACGITADQAKQILPDAKYWLQSAVARWKDWVALCLVSQIKGINCGCTFERISQVNPDPLAEPDSAQVAAFKLKLASRLGISQQDLDAIFLAASRRVDRSIRTGQPLRYFKGKWLSHMMQQQLASKPRIADALNSGVGEHLCVSLLAQVAQHPDCDCCAAYVVLIQRVMERL